MHCHLELAVERRIFVISHQEDGLAQPAAYVAMLVVGSEVQKAAAARSTMEGMRDCPILHPLHLRSG